jgi:hypothetical protein
MSDAPEVDESPERRDYALIPAEGTDGCERFFEEHSRLSHFIGFVSHLAVASDQVQKIAREALRDEPFDDAKGAVETLRRHKQLLLQLAHSRGVDNYLTYLADLLALLFENRPETMRAKLNEPSRQEQPESIPLDTVLQYSTMEDLVDALAERRVTELSHRGMHSLASYLRDKLGFELVPDAETFDEIIYIVEVRNLIAHNRAVVNRLFLQRVKDESLKLEKQIVLDVDPLFENLDVLAHSVADVDQRAVAKWSLPSHTFEVKPLLPADTD